MTFSSPHRDKSIILLFSFQVNNKMFPSPCGDKLQYDRSTEMPVLRGFPSPRGDKLQCVYANTKTLIPELFPSPRGDKLQSNRKKVFTMANMFPSPRGINCNTTRLDRAWDYIVSVPSRG